MARNVRFSAEAELAVKNIARTEGISENAAIDLAVREYDAKRRALRDSLIQQIVTEDRALLDRLAQ
jgi:hypothetical protein